MARIPTRAEQISKIPIEEIARISRNDRKILEDYVRVLRSGYNRRIESLKRKNLFSYAQEKFEGTTKQQIDKKKLTELTRNQLIFEFARYSSFFNDITSSAEGIRKVNYEQDRRLFGVNKRGKLNRTMTNDERREFWKIYDEFLNQEPTSIYRYKSETVQQMIAQASFELGTVDFKKANLFEIFDIAKKKLSQESKERDERVLPNVYTGSGIIIKK